MWRTLGSRTEPSSRNALGQVASKRADVRELSAARLQIRDHGFFRRRQRGVDVIARGVARVDDGGVESLRDLIGDRARVLLRGRLIRARRRGERGQRRPVE